MKILKWFLLLVYFSLLLYIVFFSRRREGLIWHSYLVNLIPLARTIDAFQEIPEQGWWNFTSNLLGNIILFLPFAFFVKSLLRLPSNIAVVALGVGMSIMIESIQYLFRIGVPDIDDVILNTIGTIIGVIVHNLMSKMNIFKKIFSQKYKII